MVGCREPQLLLCSQVRIYSYSKLLMLALTAVDANNCYVAMAKSYINLLQRIVTMTCTENSVKKTPLQIPASISEKNFNFNNISNYDQLVELVAWVIELTETSESSEFAFF